MHMTKRRTPLVLVLAFSALLLSACEDAEADLFLDIALDWATEKNLLQCSQAGADPGSCELEPTGDLTRWVAAEAADSARDNSVIGGLAGLASDLARPNFDEGTEAVLDTAVTARDISNADSLAQEGFESGDPEKIQEAMAIRPGDWSYDQQLSVVYLTQGNAQEASAAENDAAAKAQDHLNATLNAEGLQPGDQQALAACISTYDNLYRQREAALLAQLNPPNPEDEPAPELAEQLIRQLDLTRSHMANLQNNVAATPCAAYGAGG